MERERTSNVCLKTAPSSEEEEQLVRLEDVETLTEYRLSDGIARVIIQFVKKCEEVRHGKSRLRHNRNTQRDFCFPPKSLFS
jgi:hypothetical protein